MADCLTSLMNSCDEDRQKGTKTPTDYHNDCGREIPLDFIMHAKDGAGEKASRIKHNVVDDCRPLNVEDDRQLFSKVINTSMNLEDMLKKNEVCWLVHLNQQNQANFHQLRTVLNTVDIEPEKHGEIIRRYHSLELSQMEIVESLTGFITKLYNDYERLLKENDEFKCNGSMLKEYNEKVSTLEEEKASLVGKIQSLTHSLEDEKQNSSKKKINAQQYIATKQRMQKAETKMQDMEKKFRELENIVKSKEVIMETHGKKYKNLETNLHHLEEENKRLKHELEEVKSNESEKISHSIQNSQEIKDVEMENISLREQLKEEIVQKEQTVSELQETSSRLQAMEDKLKKLTTVLESAKKELALKDSQGRENQEKLENDINQLQIELQANKVLIKVAEDDAVIWKNKYERMESKLLQEEKKDRLPANEEQMKMEISLRDEQIAQLHTQIKSLIEMKFNERREPVAKKPRHKRGNDEVSKTAQMIELERTVDELAKDNLDLHQMLSQKNLELEQRDHIVKMQVDVLKIRDELIVLLKNRDPKKEDEIKRLTDTLRERERQIEKVMKSLKSLLAEPNLIKSQAQRNKYVKTVEDIVNRIKYINVVDTYR